jgi:hypothetical protein
MMFLLCNGLGGLHPNKNKGKRFQKHDAMDAPGVANANPPVVGDNFFASANHGTTGARL